MKLRQAFIGAMLGFAAYGAVRMFAPETVNQFYTDVKDKICVSMEWGCAPRN